MSASNRHPPETPEAAAWLLFEEISRAEKEAGDSRSNLSPRQWMLGLYAECLSAAMGRFEHPPAQLLN